MVEIRLAILLTDFHHMHKYVCVQTHTHTHNLAKIQAAKAFSHPELVVLSMQLSR